MPDKRVPPDEIILYKGHIIYVCYKDDDYDQPYDNWFTTDKKERDEYEFDVRDLPVPKGVKKNNFKQIIINAIKKGLLRFPKD